MIRYLFRFVVSGGVATSAHYLVFWLCLSLLSITPTVASAAGFLCGSVVSYLMSYYYTFGSSRSHRKALVLFYLMVATGFVINTGVVHVLVAWLGCNPWLAQICATAVTLCWNFMVSRMYIFVGKRDA